MYLFLDFSLHSKVIWIEFNQDQSYSTLKSRLLYCLLLADNYHIEKIKQRISMQKSNGKREIKTKS